MQHRLATATAATDQTTVNPFLACQSDMRRLKLKIKGVINKKLGSGDNAHPLLKSSSREFFERSEKVFSNSTHTLPQTHAKSRPHPHLLLHTHDKTISLI